MAYSTVNDIHLLNVPAAKMGAFPDDIEHFKGASGNDYDYMPGDFVPRKIYGSYLREVLATPSRTGIPCFYNLLDDERSTCSPIRIGAGPFNSGEFCRRIASCWLSVISAAGAANRNERIYRRR